MDACRVEIVNLGGYVPGVKTTMDHKTAEGLAKAGHVKILDGESNKLAPESSKEISKERSWRKK